MITAAPPRSSPPRAHSKAQQMAPGAAAGQDAAAAVAALASLPLPLAASSEA